MSRSGFVAGGYTPFSEEYVEDEIVIGDSLERRNKAQRVFGYENFGPSRTMRNSFVLIFGADED